MVVCIIVKAKINSVDIIEKAVAYVSRRSVNLENLVCSFLDLCKSLVKHNIHEN